MKPDTQRTISDLETLKVYFDPLRTRIVRALANQPKTVHQIANELGLPFTRLYYHINLLEDHGLIRVVDTRDFSGAVEEKYYQVSARSFVVDRRLLTIDPSGGYEGLNALMDAVLTSTNSDITRSVEMGLTDLEQVTPHPAALLLRRGIVAMPPERAAYFHKRLTDVLREFSNEESGDLDDPYYAIVVGLYPSALPLDASDD